MLRVLNHYSGWVGPDRTEMRSVGTPRLTQKGCLRAEEALRLDRQFLRMSLAARLLYCERRQNHPRVMANVSKNGLSRISYRAH